MPPTLSLAGALVAETQEAILVCSWDGLVLECNPAASALIGRPAEQLAGASIDAAVDLTPPLHADPMEGRDRLLRRADGSWAHVRARLRVIHDGDAPRVCLFLADVSEHKALEARLLREATSDPLTGLANRMRLLEQLSAERAALRAGGPPRAVIFLDLDRFKAVNDTHGHRAGDLVLCEVARRLRAGCVEGDTLARLGGDEFVLLTDAAGADDRARALLDALAAPIRCGAVSFEISASVGVALLDVAGDDDLEALRRSDLAMYEAKRAGRGRVRMAGEARVRVCRCGAT